MSGAHLREILASSLPSLMIRRFATDPLPPAAPTAERYAAAVLCTDMPGFTALTERLTQRGPFSSLRTITKRNRIPLVCLLLYVLLPSIAKATNGLNLIDSGGISAAIAGADTAVSLDFSTINSNPAGISRLPGTSLGLSLAVLQGTLSLRNSLNDRDGENQPVVIPHMGLVRYLSGTPFTLGLGLFTMGGYIAEFEPLNIPRFGPGGVFGATVDKQSAQLRHVKLTPTIAYEVTKDLSLGVGLGISYVDISLKILPNTPGMPNGPAASPSDRARSILRAWPARRASRARMSGSVAGRRGRTSGGSAASLWHRSWARATPWG